MSLTGEHKALGGSLVAWATVSTQHWGTGPSSEVPAFPVWAATAMPKQLSAEKLGLLWTEVILIQSDRSVDCFATEGDAGSGPWTWPITRLEKPKSP